MDNKWILILQYYDLSEKLLKRNETSNITSIYGE